MSLPITPGEYSVFTLNNGILYPSCISNISSWQPSIEMVNSVNPDQTAAL